MNLVKIVEVIEEETKLNDILNKSRKRRYVDARRILFFILRNAHRLSYQEIGNLCGGKNHATVLHSLRHYEFILKTEPNFKNLHDRIITRVGGKKTEVELLWEKITILESELLTIKKT
tara:strand:+ start:8780 stop:9133 length:354 start_codon:yes stop_codon:yes gene_type:complete